MVRLALRFFGVLILATAFVALVIDATRSIADKTLIVTSFGQTAAQLSPAKFDALQDVVKQHAHPFLFDPVLVDFLKLPTWLVIGALGALFLRLARHPQPKIGFSSR